MGVSLFSRVPYCAKVPGGNKKKKRTHTSSHSPSAAAAASAVYTQLTSQPLPCRGVRLIVSTF